MNYSGTLAAMQRSLLDYTSPVLAVVALAGLRNCVRSYTQSARGSPRPG